MECYILNLETKNPSECIVELYNMKEHKRVA